MKTLVHINATDMRVTDAARERMAKAYPEGLQATWTRSHGTVNLALVGSISVVWIWPATQGIANVARGLLWSVGFLYAFVAVAVLCVAVFGLMKQNPNDLAGLLVRRRLALWFSRIAVVGAAASAVWWGWLWTAGVFAVGAFCLVVAMALVRELVADRLVEIAAETKGGDLT